MDITRAEEILKHINDKRVLVFGDTMLDRYITGRVERLNPEAPVPILEAIDERRATGGAGNTAKNVAMLGGRAIMVAVGGGDAVARELEQAASEEGYEVRLVADPTRPTTEKIRYVVRTQQMLRVDYEEKHDVGGQAEDEVVRMIKDAAGQVDGILVSDYAKGAVTPKTAEAIMQAANEHNLPVMADVKPGRINFFTGADFISPNIKEGHEFLGLNRFENPKPHQELAASLREAFDANVFLTMSENGIYVLNKAGESFHANQKLTHDDEVLDTSGCGDSAAAAILLGKLAGASDEEAAELGHLAGNVNAKKIGAAGVTPEEVLDLLKHYAGHQA